VSTTAISTDAKALPEIAQQNDKNSGKNAADWLL
jgi:hypothetical protein